VLVVMNDQIHGAHSLTKTSTTEVETFMSPLRGVVGITSYGKQIYYNTPPWRHTSATEFDISKVTELPRVDVIAARDSAGKMWLALTNLDPNRAADIELAGARVSRANGQTLVAPKFDSVNTFEAPDVVAPKPFTAKASGNKLPLKLAPASVTVVSLE